MEKKCSRDRADGESLSDVAARTLNVRFGSLAAVPDNISGMSAFGSEAAVKPPLRPLK